MQEKTESRTRFPMGWLVRYPSRHWLVREVRLWHGEKEYEVFEFQLRGGVVLRGGGTVDSSWCVVD